MDSELFLFALLALAVADDVLKREVHPIIGLALLATGALRSHLLSLLASLAVSLIITYALYYIGFLGGGDLFLILGLTAWLPLFKGLPLSPVLIPLAVLLSSIAYPFVYFRGFTEAVGWRWVPLLFPAVILPPLYAFIYAGLVFAYFWMRNGHVLFLREKTVDELEPEDVLAFESPCLPKGRRVLQPKDIERLKECGEERVLVLEDLPPFAPFIALAFLMLCL